MHGLSTAAELRGGKRRIVLLLDFRVPGARDSTRLPAMLAACREICRSFGPENSVLMSLMATLPKEDSTGDVLDDEATVAKQLRGAGFTAQQRIRMNVDHPTCVAGRLVHADWVVLVAVVVVVVIVGI
jgi:hypothetical protein